MSRRHKKRVFNIGIRIVLKRNFPYLNIGVYDMSATIASLNASLDALVAAVNALPAVPAPVVVVATQEDLDGLAVKVAAVDAAVAAKAVVPII